MRNKNEIERKLASLKRSLYDLELTGYARTKKQEEQLNMLTGMYEFEQWVLNNKPQAIGG